MKTLTQKHIEKKNIEPRFIGDIYSVKVKDGMLYFNTIFDFKNTLFELSGLSELDRENWEKRVGFNSLYSDFTRVIAKVSSPRNRKRHVNTGSTVIKKNPFGSEYIAPNVFEWEYSYIVNSTGEVMIQGQHFQISVDTIINLTTNRKVNVIEHLDEINADFGIDSNLGISPDNKDVLQASSTIQTSRRITYTGYDPTIIKFFDLDGFGGSTDNIQNLYDENHPNPHPSTGGAGYGPNYGWYPKLWHGSSHTWNKVAQFSNCYLVVESNMWFKQRQINGLQVETKCVVMIRLYYEYSNALYDFPQIRLVEILGGLNSGFIFQGSKPLGGVATSWQEQQGPFTYSTVNDSQFKFSNGDIGGNNVYTLKDYQHLNKSNRPNITYIHFPHNANLGIKSTKGVPYFDFCKIKIYMVCTKVQVTSGVGGFNVGAHSLDTHTSLEVFDGMVLY